MPQIDVQIMGQGYVLACQDGGEQTLRAAVGRVDEAMCRIRDGGKIKARDRIAVLAAVNLAFDRASESKTDPRPAALPTAPVAGGDERVQALIGRLDRALALDGQLI
jgi:cell division protein ZapA